MKSTLKTTTYTLIIVFLIFLTPISTFSNGVEDPHEARIVPLEPIDGYVGSEITDLGTYLQQMFNLGVSGTAALAVVMIIIGGITYMTADGPGGKEKGKEIIRGALWGLLIAIAAILILITINPDIVKLELVNSINSIKEDLGD